MASSTFKGTTQKVVAHLEELKPTKLKRHETEIIREISISNFDQNGSITIGIIMHDHISKKYIASPLKDPDFEHTQHRATLEEAIQDSIIMKKQFLAKHQSTLDSKNHTKEDKESNVETAPRSLHPSS